MKQYLLLMSALLATGCSSTHVLLQPELSDGQEINYSRGRSKINSQSLFKPELAVLEYSEDEMVVGIGITNFTDKPLLLSEDNLVAERLSAGETEQAIIYHFDDLVKDAAKSGYSTAYQVGDVAASVGVSFIPFGGIVYSLGKLFYSLGSSQTAGSPEERVDQLTYSQLNNNYFRQQTVAPEVEYSGILKLGFDGDFEEGDKVTFKLTVGGQVENFVFICKESEKK